MWIVLQILEYLLLLKKNIYSLDIDITGCFKYHIPSELKILNSHDQLLTGKNGVAMPLPRKKCHEISLNVSFLSSFK